MTGKTENNMQNSNIKDITSVEKQDISRLIKVLALCALVSFAVGELYFFKIHYHPVGYLFSLIPVLFGLWRISTEKNMYQKVRIIVIVATYVLFWFIIPVIFKVKVPILGGQWGDFPQLHTVGSLVFFIYFAVILLFGRRVDCGWCCPCVTARETMGYPFRDKTIKSEFWWKLRHLKWFPFALMIVYLVFMIVDASTAYNRAGKLFYNFVSYTYYASFLIIPLTGNRNFCRILCPFAALWGLLSVSGLYRIKADVDACLSCGKCDSVCDMGIPVSKLVQEKGQIRTVECMGCGRCVNVCPAEALQFQSAASKLMNLLPFGGTASAQDPEPDA